ncbi:MAG: hypothetical protein IID32_07105, partial [Planctomycetes bacterium]|nr:hypothetical protein [Planctomycetota bacterium]
GIDPTTGNTTYTPLISKADLNQLKADLNSANQTTKEAAQADLFTRSQDVQLTLGDNFIQFNFLIADSVFPKSPTNPEGILTVPIDFEIGAPGLGLNVDSDIEIRMSYVFGFGFGFSTTDGFYLDTSGISPSGEELAFNLSATIPGAKLTGNLGFLNLEISDVPVDAVYNLPGDPRDGLPRDEGLPSGIFSSCEIDVQGGVEGRLGLKNFGSIALEARFNASADVDLDGIVKIGTGDEFPAMSTTIHYDQVFADVSWSTANGFQSTFFASPTIVFEDVSLDLGSFFTTFVDPLLVEFKKVTEPLQPIIDELTRPVPIVSDLKGEDTSILDLLQQIARELKKNGVRDPYGSIPAVDAVVTLTKIVIQVVELVNSIPTTADLGTDSVIINFGTFNIGSSSGSGSNATNALNASSAKSSGFSSTRDNSDGGYDLDSQLNSKTSGKGKSKSKAFTSKSKDGGFKFPLLTNPSTVVNLLLSKPVDLFTYTLPDLNLNVDISGGSAPLQPGFIIEIGVNIALDVALTIGFDTSGLIQFQSQYIDTETGKYTNTVTDTTVANNLYDDATAIFNGFYLSDNVIKDGHGKFYDIRHDFGAQDHPEVALSIGVHAKAAVGISGIVEAGVKGGAEAGLYLNLHDSPQMIGNLVIGPQDGKLHLDEALARIIDFGPHCLFDVSGQIRASLEAFLWVGLDLGFLGEITIIDESWTIAKLQESFTVQCPPLDKPIGSAISAGVITLHMGPNANLRSANGTLNVDDNPNRSTVYVIDQFFEDPNEIFVRVAQTQAEANAHGIQIGETYEEPGRGDVTSVDYEGHVLEYTGTISKIVGFGGDGTIDSETGNLIGDTILIKKRVTADIELHGGAGNDSFRSDGSGAVAMYGGRGDDLLVSNSGNDLLVGGDGNDIIFGRDGRDRIYGGAGDDVLDGGAGNDHIEGGLGNDKIKGGLTDGLSAKTNASAKEDDDYLFGYADTAAVHVANGYFGAMTFGHGASTVVVSASLNQVALAGGAETADGDDNIQGNNGNDYIVGSYGDDRITGGDGQDIIFAGRGNDSISGGLAIDVIDAGPGSDTINWASGDGADIITGGIDDPGDIDTLVMTADAREPSPEDLENVLDVLIASGNYPGTSDPIQGIIDQRTQNRIEDDILMIIYGGQNTD